jgi:amino acid adenylation domain-containing protein/thioester reductase-like protein
MPVNWCWLVFLDSRGLGDELVKLLENNGQRVITVRIGEKFKKEKNTRFSLHPDHAYDNDYNALFAELCRMETVPDRIVHLWSVTGPDQPAAIMDIEGLNQIKNRGYYSLEGIARAIGQQDITRDIQLQAISDNLYEVTGEDGIYPEKAMILGQTMVIPTEFANIKSRVIDLVLPSTEITGGEPGKKLVQQLFDELISGAEEPVVAYRGGYRWVQCFEPRPLEPPGEKSIRLKPGGVYLITGGLGGVGLVMAEYLAKKVGTALILTGRTGLPPREQWEQVIAGTSPHEGIGLQIRKVKEIEEMGAGLLVMRADVADPGQMQEVVARAQQQLGPVSGIIHCAALTDGHMIQLRTRETSERIFRTKITGTLVLDALFKDKDLDFFVLCSSLNSVLPAFGQAGYCAANAFLNTFAQRRHVQGGAGAGDRLTVSIAWDRWLGTGSSVIAEKRHLEITGEHLQEGMSGEQGMEVFNRILANSLPQVLISLSDIRSSIKNAYQYQGSLLKAQWEKANTLKTTVPRPRLDTPYTPPQTPIEKTITEIFQKMFGYEQIGIHDDFFELGLDSIKAIQIRARMSKRGYSVQLEDFFKYSTTATLAPMVTILAENTAGWEKGEPGDPANQTPEALQIPAETMKILQTRYPDQIQDVYPLTPMQEGMLFYSLYETVNIQPYFEQVSYRLHREMEVALIEKSANELIRRHDILRTAFVSEGVERPLQVVLKKRNVEFTYRDLRAAYPGNREGKEAFIAEYKEKDKRRSFNLGSDVLIRLSVLQTEQAEYELIWSYHHALMDAWCMGILTADYLAIYNRMREGKPHGLPPVPPFRAYIQWLAGQDKARALGFWKNYLEGFEEMTAIPKKKNLADKARLLQEEFAGARLSTVLEIETTRRLQEIAARARVTVSTIFHALWAILLGKYTGKQDVVFGSVVSGRPATLEGVENMVGCFINTIPVRVRFDGQTSFQQLIGQLQEDILRTGPYHYFSLAEIQAQTQLKQNFLDHFIEFQNYPMAQQIEEVGDRLSSDYLTEPLDISHFQVFEQGNYDFIFDILPRERIRLSFTYNANVYDTELLTRLGKHTLNVLEQITRDREIPIKGIRLLSETEERQILLEFNKKGDFARDKTVIHLVEKQALHTPDRAAAVYRDTVLTYRELHERARAQAVILRDHGIGPDRTVGILMPRTPLMMACILGVWQAGGAYLPIDPGCPRERIDYMLKDSSAKILLTANEITSFSTECIVTPEAFLNSSEGRPFTSHHSSFITHHSSNLAYIIYTSGSTGTPKGVMIEHTGMMNHIQVKINDLNLNPGGIIAQNATHTFDISVWQFFTALTLGGRTVIYPDILILEPRRFISQLANHGVTILEVVPSYLTMMLEVLTAGDSEIYKLPLQFLLVTGEEIKPNLVKNWFEKYPGIKMVNAYGPTEASDDITHYMMDGTPRGERIPIGHPVQNMQVYILDDFKQLTPIGIKGEICVTGVGVGRGYLNNPELTNEKFLEVQEPFFKKVPGRRRLYLTGDVGRWLPGGAIEFFGRKDDQVKIRGYRVETGEIENRLNAYGPVQQAVVVEGKKREGDNYLCAYLVMKSHTHLNHDELKKYLQGNLPAYMIPSYFIPIEAVPLTANGKIDKTRLPVPQMEPTGEYIAPRNKIEEILVNVWSKALNLEKESIGIDDNFFQLGGHSLIMVRVVSLLARDFNIRIEQIFRHPTIAGLAAHISYNKNKLKRQLQGFITRLESQTGPGATTQETTAAIDPSLETEYRQYQEKVTTDENLDLSGARNYRHILLTGGTGYLGPYVLYELLNRKETFNYLIVRGKSQAEAEKRLEGILSFYFGGDFYPRNRERLTVIPTDLTLPDLGLDKKNYRRLAEKVEVIVHSAGDVRHFGLYRDYYNSNVKATENLLEFALAARKKDFHHISTLGVCSGLVEGKNSQLFSEYCHDCGQQLQGDYLKTKFEAEKRVMAIREKGLKTSIYRPGNLVFHSGTGKFQVNISSSAFYSLLSAIIKLGMIPEEFNRLFDFTFVDCFSRAFFLLFDREALTDELFHLFNDQGLSSHDLVMHLNANGEKIRRVPLAEFVRCVYDNLDNPAIRDHMDRFLFHFGIPLVQEDITINNKASEEVKNPPTQSMVVCDRTKMLLAKRGFQWPPVTGEHIKKMLKHCREVGFLHHASAPG